MIQRCMDHSVLLLLLNFKNLIINMLFLIVVLRKPVFGTYA